MGLLLLPSLNDLLNALRPEPRPRLTLEVGWDHLQTKQLLTQFRFRFFPSEINECDSDPCMNDGNCTDLANNVECQCNEQFQGVFCESGKFISLYERK